MIEPQTFFPYRQRRPCAESVPLEALAREHGTPLYVYSAGALRRSIDELERAFPTSRKPLLCYAVKANSNLSILRELAMRGLGADVVSSGELVRALKAGVSPSRIVFSGVGKRTPEILQALSHDIFSFNVESTDELDRTDALARSVGKQPSVALRFNPDVSARTHPYISTGLRKNKFGINRAEILRWVRAHRDSALRIDGVSIHIGSQILTLAPYREAIARAVELVEELEKILKRPLKRIDLGGGLGIAYRGERTVDVRSYARLITQLVPTRLQVVLEPGRSLIGNAGVLVTEVLYRKERPQKDFLVVDAAMNDLMRPALYQSYHEVLPVLQTSRSARRKTDVVGPVCESSDCLAQDRALPKSLKSGDLLAVLSAGAYGFSMSSQYNSRPRAAEVWVDGDRFRLIRKRETFQDLVRGEC